MESVRSSHNIPQRKKVCYEKRKRKVFGEIRHYVFLQNHQKPSTPVPFQAKYVEVTTLCCLKATFLI